MSKGPKKPRYRVPAKGAARRDPRDPIRMVTNPGSLQAVSPSSEDFDLDIDLSDLDSPPLEEADPRSVTDVSDFYGDEDEPTLEVGKFNEQQQADESTRTVGVKDIQETEYQLQAPAPPVDIQPLYRPAIGDDGPIAEPVETLSTPDLSDRQLKDGESDVGGLFDDLSEERSVPTQAVAPPPRRKTEPPPPPPVNNPSSSPGRKHRFASGVTAGMQPLDVQIFDKRPTEDRNKRSPQTSGSFYTNRNAQPLPMAEGQRIKKKSIGLQEILLIILVLMLGLATWVGYKIYKNQQTEKEAAALDVSREQFQQLKDDVIEKNKKKKETDPR